MHNKIITVRISPGSGSGPHRFSMLSIYLGTFPEQAPSMCKIFVTQAMG